MMAVSARAVVCLSLLVFVCQVRGSHVSLKMNKTIQSLLQYYNISARLRFARPMVFPREQFTGRIETQKVYMAAVLETYEKLITHMMEGLPTPSPQTADAAAAPAAAAAVAAARPGENNDVKSELSYILKLIKNLRKNNYEKESTLLQRLQALRDIKMDDRVVQSKALWELPLLYNEASVLTDHHDQTEKQRKRRRRHTHKNKIRPRI